MAFTDVTSTASVRAVLGVSEKELRDTVLVDPVYSVRLTENLRNLHADLFADFVTVSTVDPRSDDQQRFFDLVQTYAAYLIASYVAGSAISMFAPMTIKDSKSEVTRVADPFKNLRADILATLSVLRTSLLTAYNAVNPASPLPTASQRLRVLIAPLAINPVTGA